MDKPLACPPRPQANKSRRSGHSVGYQNRTTSFAIDKRLSKVFLKPQFVLHMFQAAKFGRRWRSGSGETERQNAFEMFRSQSGRRVEAEGNFFIWIRCNPLKSPDSAKENQGNASFFSWIYLVLLGFIWTDLAARLYLPGPERPDPLLRGRVGVRVPRRAPLPSSGGFRPPPAPGGRREARTRARGLSRPARPSSSCRRAGPRR